MKKVLEEKYEVKNEAIENKENPDVDITMFNLSQKNKESENSEGDDVSNNFDIIIEVND